MITPTIEQMIAERQSRMSVTEILFAEIQKLEAEVQSLTIQLARERFKEPTYAPAKGAK